MTRWFTVCALATGATLAGSAAGSIPVYSNVTTQDASGFVFGGYQVAGLELDGGGQLSTVTFTLAGSPFAWELPEVTDADVVLALSNGSPDKDGVIVPDFDDPSGADTLLLDLTLTDLPVTKEVQFLTIDVSSYDIVVPDNALIWAGVNYSEFDVGQALFGPATVGSAYSYGFVYDDFSGGWSQNEFFDGMGLGWQINVVPAPAGLALLMIPAALGQSRRRQVC